MTIESRIYFELKFQIEAKKLKLPVLLRVAIILLYAADNMNY